MTTSVIQQKGLPKDYFLHIKGDSQKYHRSGEKPRVIPQPWSKKDTCIAQVCDAGRAPAPAQCPGQLELSQLIPALGAGSWRAGFPLPYILSWWFLFFLFASFSLLHHVR